MLAAGRCVFHLHCSVRSPLCDLPCVELVPVAFQMLWHARLLQPLILRHIVPVDWVCLGLQFILKLSLTQTQSR